MGILDFVLLGLGFIAGMSSFLTGSDSLYKLFLGLIIGFLTYLVVSFQLEITQFTNPGEWNQYQSFIANHSTGVLSTVLLAIPVLGIFFMLNNRFSILVFKKSPSHLLLGLLLPVFLVGILANLADGSILSENAFWKQVFIFFAQSLLFQTFQKLPWVIFVLLGFLIFYKSLFLILVAFFQWIWNDVFPEFHKEWKESRKKSPSGKQEGDENEEESDDFS